MDAAGVDMAVLIPPSFEGDRNDLVAQAVARFPERFLAMGSIDAEHPMPAIDVSRVLVRNNLSGFRLRLSSAEGAAMLRKGGPDWLWRACVELDIPLMVAVGGLISGVAAVAQTYPDLRVVVDHLGLAVTTPPNQVMSVIEDLSRLAAYPNVAVKASALPCYTREQHEFPIALGLIDTVVARFGAERVFWGSDLTRLPPPYKEWVSTVVSGPSSLSDDDRRLVLGDALLAWLNPGKDALDG
jgi:L-fuconolactonase